LRLVIGLGNPGLKFKESRHNLGFMVVEELARKIKVSFKRNIYCKAYISLNKEVILAKPYTFMNLSGFSVRRLKEKFDVSLRDILVICDDLNLPLGKLRLKLRGSSGGHKGLSSIIQALESEDFPRLRIGIGRPLEEDFSSFVLSKFSQEELSIVKEAISKAVSCVQEWIYQDFQRLMAKYN